MLEFIVTGIVVTCMIGIVYWIWRIADDVSDDDDWPDMGGSV